VSAKEEFMGFTAWLRSPLKSKTSKTSLSYGFDIDGTVSKELFYGVLDAQSSLFLFFSKKKGWIGANRLFLETFEYKDIDAFREKNSDFHAFIDHEEEEIFTETDHGWLEYIRLHRKDGYGVRVKTKDDELHHYNVKVALLHQKGEPLYTVELTDVTRLIEAQKKSEEIELMKSEFLSNVGHEFRTPMNGVIGFIDLLEKSHPTASQREYIQMISTSAQSLMSNIESLLDLSQMQGGRLRLNISEFNPVAELESMARHYAIVGKDKGLNISFFIDSRLPTYVEGDLRKLKQVLHSLIGNAIKFTLRGDKVLVEVKLLKHLDHDRCQISFSVSDTGRGIPETDLSKITQPFVSGDQADKRLGVGLSLSQGLVEMMDSRLEIISEEGLGSKFSFIVEFSATTVQAYDQIKGKRAKVVLFDEKRIGDANVLTEYLRSFGLEVTKVHEDDKKLFEETDIVYLVASQEHSSWMMKLGSYNKKCRVVLLLDDDEKLRSRSTHLVDYGLSKPLLPSKLSKHLTQVFKLPIPQMVSTKYVKEGISALVAEDNLINQRLIKILLQEYNIKVTTASDGDIAVGLCRDYHFDIVFMDIDMPVKDGITATQEIKETMSSDLMPIIALTAMAMDGDRETILKKGLDDYLCKPLTREKLEYILEKYLKVTV